MHQSLFFRNVKNVIKLSEQELRSGNKTSWHDQYRSSAWLFIGGLPYDLSEGDLICVFSQYGEIVNVNLIRDKKTGKQKGFGFLCYEDQRSTNLAVDNLNGIKVSAIQIHFLLWVFHCIYSVIPLIVFFFLYFLFFSLSHFFPLLQKINNQQVIGKNRPRRSC